MMNGFLIILIAIVCSSYHIIAQPANVSPISYQIHSQNDLRQWPQTLMKGATWFKVDPHYADPQTCAKVSHVNPCSGALGCMLLTHDTPDTSRTIFYNTTDDLLLMIQDRNNHIYFGNPDRRIYIALCFKYDSSFGDVCDSSQSSTNWRALIDDFMARAKNMIETFQLNLEFILDGDGTPRHTCLANRWRPFNSTFIAFVDPPAGGTSDDPTLGYDRYSINNMQELTVGLFQLVNYNKFSKPNRPNLYPFLVWEPSDQSAIVNVGNTYLNSHYYQNPLGLRFAINIDPVLFTFYASSIRNSNLTPTTWSIQRTSQQLSNNGIGLYVTSPKLSSYWDNQGFTHIVQAYMIDNQLEFQFYNQSSIELYPIIDGTPFLISNTCSKKNPLTSLQVLLINNVMTIFFGCDRTLITYTVSGAGLHTIPSSISTTLSAWSLVESNDTNDTLWMIRTASTSSCDVGMEIYNMNQAGGYSLNPILPYACLISSTRGIMDIQITAITLNDVKTSVCSTLPSTSIPILAYISYSTYDNTTSQPYVSIIRVCIDPLSGKWSTTNNVKIDIGRSSSLALYHSQSTQHVTLTVVATDSFCYNSHTHNIQANPSVCDQVPKSLSQVMSYSMGEIEEWEQWIDQSNPPLLTSCYPHHIAHGTWHMGTAPAISPWSGPCDSSAPCLISTHIGNTAIDSGSCGQAPIGAINASLIMSSWPRFFMTELE